MLYHCIVLQKLDEDNEDCHDNISQISDWSTLTMQHSVDLALHVYESIELELNLVSSERPQVSVGLYSKKPNSRKSSMFLVLQVPFEYQVLLQMDPTSPSRYFCSHNAGVHSITLPMVGQLAELVQKADETILQDGIPMVEQNSIVQHLVCTQPFAKSIPAPVQALTIAYPPAKLYCITSDYKLISMVLSRNQIGQAQPLLCTGSSSPLKNDSAGMGGKTSFEKHIATVLHRTTTNPLMKCSSTLTSEQCYEILARSTKVLREEYIDKFDQARSEIEKRVAGLEARKRQQHLSLATLTQERFELRDKAAQLSEKYEDLRDNAENFNVRIEAVLNAIQRALPCTTDSEVRMQRQLQNIERKVKDLTNALEQIKAKERYQLRQIQQSQENLHVKMTHDNATASLAPNQVENMKEVLQQDGKDLKDMMQKLTRMKKELF